MNGMPVPKRKKSRGRISLRLLAPLICIITFVTNSPAAEPAPVATTEEKDQETAEESQLPLRLRELVYGFEYRLIGSDLSKSGIDNGFRGGRWNGDC